MRRRVDHPLEGEGCALRRGPKELVERLHQEHVDVEVDTAKVLDGQVAEEVDPLDGRRVERLVERPPARLPLLDEGGDVLVLEEEVRPVGMQLPHAAHELSPTLRQRARLPRLYDDLRDRRRRPSTICPAGRRRRHAPPIGGSVGAAAGGGQMRRRRRRRGGSRQRRRRARRCAPVATAGAGAATGDAAAGTAAAATRRHRPAEQMLCVEARDADAAKLLEDGLQVAELLDEGAEGEGGGRVILGRARVARGAVELAKEPMQRRRERAAVAGGADGGGGGGRHLCLHLDFSSGRGGHGHAATCTGLGPMLRRGRLRQRDATHVVEEPAVVVEVALTRCAPLDEHLVARRRPVVLARRVRQRRVVDGQRGAGVLEGGARRAEARQAYAHRVLPLGVVVRHVIPRGPFHELSDEPPQPLRTARGAGQQAAGQQAAGQSSGGSAKRQVRKSGQSGRVEQSREQAASPQWAAELKAKSARLTSRS